MKRPLRFISLPLLVIMVTASCSKDEAEKKEFCVECTMKETSLINGIEPTVTTMTVENCGWNQTTLDAYLKSGNTTVTSNNGGTTITIKLETTCQKK
ncbi:hypothetical protein BDE36_4630 [Arcticibacter tournemirensis]|uniref:Uncharacterized protein n=1 Tax=Arcticibacter tournemirensis TaxID=699437 RepID=A0A5M9HHD9_9SPHI|nr:hypothetical protein [Arcticibacter tournemirensis]KAA8485873.1 hypothetical protein F1649_02420 [Arcticibacter tournemirensis]TQM46874.1 hypothetical protein BDE36_4630 [Arcticibacter tournemirensis]